MNYNTSESQKHVLHVIISHCFFDQLKRSLTAQAARNARLNMVAQGMLSL